MDWNIESNSKSQTVQKGYSFMAKTKIMIVEDEIITAMTMKSSLSRLGYEICEFVTSGEASIENVEQEKPDIVLMDIILDGRISGIEAAEEIHSRYDIPIIFVTGCQDEGTKELAKEVGPVEYLIKPVETEDLKLSIEKALQRKE
jgi:CheY-like chemotaxis protein